MAWPGRLAGRRAVSSVVARASTDSEVGGKDAAGSVSSSAAGTDVVNRFCISSIGGSLR